MTQVVIVKSKQEIQVWTRHETTCGIVLSGVMSDSDVIVDQDEIAEERFIRWMDHFKQCIEVLQLLIALWCVFIVVLSGDSDFTCLLCAIVILL